MRIRAADLFNIAVPMLLAAVLFGCAASAPERKTSDHASRSETHGGATECEATVKEAIRLHDVGVRAADAGRGDAGLTSIEESIVTWRKITDGGLHCDRDTVTVANDHLEQALRDRDEISRAMR